MGRSKITGQITVVLYEDPPDGIPKIHIRSSKYMAWIAEQGMPVHMHVEKVRKTVSDWEFKMDGHMDRKDKGVPVHMHVEKVRKLCFNGWPEKIRGYRG